MEGNVLILGGTGTLGRELIRQLDGKCMSITVLSRDEHKQQLMKRQYPNVRFVLGDIRDLSSIEDHFREKDVVFHVAALKHIDHLEENPIESMKTNVLGTINVAKAAINAEVRYCVFSSTDKAVDPINTYGYCKALSEKILLQMNYDQSITRFSIFRWGNVLNSQGSVIPYFIDLLRKGDPIPITSKEMTRFWIRIEDAVEFMINTFRSGETKTKVMVHPEMRASKLTDVISVLGEMTDNHSQNFKMIGLRKGEKLHEALRSQHSESPICSKTCKQYSTNELHALLGPLVNATTRK